MADRRSSLPTYPNLNKQLTFSQPFSSGPALNPAVRPLFSPPDYEGQAVSLRCETLISPNAETTPANLTGLTNTTGKMVEINEIRFTLFGTTQYSTSQAHLEVKLMAGSIPLTHDYIPIGLFNRFVNNHEVSNPAVGSYRSATNCVWRMPVGVLVPPGALITPTFRQPGYVGSTANLTARVQMMGRTTGKAATGKLRIPYVCAFRSEPNVDAVAMLSQDEFGGNSGLLTNITSNNNNLVNLTGADLNVEYFTGRLFQSYWNNAIEFGNNGVRVVDQADCIYDPLVNVRMTTGSGLEIVREPSPFNIVFNNYERFFPSTLTLSSDDYVVASLDFNYQSYSTLVSPRVINNLFAQIGMVGSYLINV